MNQLSLRASGVELRRRAIDPKICDDLRNALEKLENAPDVGSPYGIRNLLERSARIREFSESSPVRAIAEEILGPRARVVRAIFFDKTPDANWKVPWHQDLTIAVRERVETEGFTVWTKKSDVDHVQPPVGLLENMVTLRFHLDAADESNGALKVIPGSHRGGRLSADQIKSVREANESVLCRVEEGDCLVMRPLILHASSAGLSPRRRRVVHFEFAAEALPGQLDWYGS